MKPIITFALIAELAITFVACGKPQASKQTDVSAGSTANDADWVYELKRKNPLRCDMDFISVYFKFDTIINDYEVSGILYPLYSTEYGWSVYENGARLFFHSRKTGKDYVWTDWEKSCRRFKNIFMSKNVADIVSTEGFEGFKNGDSFVFHYDTCHGAENPLYTNAEYQFYDIDFDGEDELLLGFYQGGPYRCTMYEVYELTDNGLEKRLIDIDDYSQIDVANKTLMLLSKDGCCHSVRNIYQGDGRGNLSHIYSVDERYDSQSESVIIDTTYYNQ